VIFKVGFELSGMKTGILGKLTERSFLSSLGSFALRFYPTKEDNSHYIL
jgi:hypothetical protein